jgi:hypothetical protein
MPIANSNIEIIIDGLEAMYHPSLPTNQLERVLVVGLEWPTERTPLFNPFGAFVLARFSFEVSSEKLLDKTRNGCEVIVNKSMLASVVQLFGNQSHQQLIRKLAVLLAISP